MPHLQQQILDQIQAVLVAGATAAGSRVYVDRVDPLHNHDLPAILVDESPEGELVQPFTIGGVYRRDLAVQINCVVTDGDGAAAQARELALAVEKLLQASQPLAALCTLGIDITASRHQVSGDGDRLLATRETSWTMSYAAPATTPDTPF